MQPAIQWTAQVTEKSLIAANTAPALVQAEEEEEKEADYIVQSLTGFSYLEVRDDAKSRHVFISDRSMILAPVATMLSTVVLCGVVQRGEVVPT